MLRSKRSSVSLFLHFALLLALAAGAAFGQPAKPAAQPGGAVALADGILVDKAGQVAYLMSPRRGIDAVELASGTVRWTADAAAKPLLVAGDVLIAQAEATAAGRLDIVSFDVRDGSPAKLRARLDLPADVTARLRDTMKSSFRVRARLSGDQVTLSWSATKAAGDDVAQGYLPAAEEGMAPALDKSQIREPAKRQAPRQLQGAAVLDLASGRLEPAAKAVDVPRPLDMLRGQLEGAKGQLFTSADRRHVLASARDTGDVWQSYRWTIYDRATGERLGETAHYSSSAPFLVADTRLMFVAQPYLRARGDEIVSVPLQLRVIDLASGAELVTKEAGDSSFRDIVPP